MPILRKSPTELREIARRILQDDGTITHFSRSGVVRSLVECAVEQISEVYDTIDFFNAMTTTTSAAGAFLDQLALDRGVSRLQARTAYVTAENRIIRFYSKDRSTPLNNLLSGGKIPEGTLIQNSDASVIYSVDRDFYVTQEQIEVYVAATSTVVGAAQNVGKNILTTHNLGISTVAVTNDFSINTGANIETDDNLRYRVTRSLDFASGATGEAIRTAALTFPEVADVRLRQFSDGVGTFEVLIIPVGNDISETSLDNLQSTLESIAAYGTRVSVKAPDRIRVQIAVQLLFNETATDIDRSNARRTARAFILGYINSLTVGGTLVPQQILASAIQSSPSTLDAKILVFRIDGSPVQLRNIKAREDEVFVLDDETDDAIKVL